MRTLFVTLFASTLLLCLGGTAFAQDSMPATSAQKNTFGEGVADASKAVALDSVLTKAESHKDKDVLVKGKVLKVCRKKGCWFVLQGADKSKSIRITMKDYGFFVPTDCNGRDATVAGKLVVKTISEKMRKHLAEDEGKDPSNIKGDVTEYNLVATGVVLH